MSPLRLAGPVVYVMLLLPQALYWRQGDQSFRPDLPGGTCLEDCFRHQAVARLDASAHWFSETISHYEQGGKADGSEMFPCRILHVRYSFI